MYRPRAARCSAPFYGLGLDAAGIGAVISQAMIVGGVLAFWGVGAVAAGAAGTGGLWGGLMLRRRSALQAGARSRIEDETLRAAIQAAEADAAGGDLELDLEVLDEFVARDPEAAEAARLRCLRQAQGVDVHIADRWLDAANLIAAALDDAHTVAGAGRRAPDEQAHAS